MNFEICIAYLSGAACNGGWNLRLLRSFIHLFIHRVYSASIHFKSNELVSSYTWVGGMHPEADGGNEAADDLFGGYNIVGVGGGLKDARE
eukprot:scaffold4769_cov45-Attheya_sp.AAC.1